MSLFISPDSLENGISFHFLYKKRFEQVFTYFVLSDPTLAHKADKGLCVIVD